MTRDEYRKKYPEETLRLQAEHEMEQAKWCARHGYPVGAYQLSERSQLKSQLLQELYGGSDERNSA